MQFWKRELITRADDSPYLDRFIIFKCRWFGIMLHTFLASDDDCPHDHPWPYLSIILKGGYHEWTPALPEVLVDHKHDACLRQWYPRFSLLWRPAHWIHRVEIDPKNPPTTLFITGGKERSWGFWTKAGWIHWSKYSSKEHCVQE